MQKIHGGLWIAIAAGVVFAGSVLAAPPPAPLELRVAGQFDPSSGDSTDDDANALVGLGFQVGESLQVGPYASVFGADRLFPNQIDTVYSLGLFAEQDLSVGYRLMPYVGASAGAMLTDGVNEDVDAHVTLSLGLRCAVNDRLSLFCAGTGHWSSSDMFDYEEGTKANPEAWSADSTDVTIDAGLRIRL